MNIPVLMAEKLRREGVPWRDVAQEIAWATGRKFCFDSIPAAVRRRKTIRLPKDPGIDHSLACDAAISALWSLKLDTCEIAKKVGLHESEVVRRLNSMRSAA